MAGKITVTKHSGDLTQVSEIRVAALLLAIAHFYSVHRAGASSLDIANELARNNRGMTRFANSTRERITTIAHRLGLIETARENGFGVWYLTPAGHNWAASQNRLEMLGLSRSP